VHGGKGGAKTNNTDTNNIDMAEKTMLDSYGAYRETVKDPVGKAEFADLLNGYNRLIIEKVLDGDEVSFPMRMGTLRMQGRKQVIQDWGDGGRLRGIAPDWHRTNLLWKSDPVAAAEKRLIYHTNLHSDGVRYKYFWSKRHIPAEFKTLYAFRVTRDNKRLASSAIKEGRSYRSR